MNKHGLDESKFKYLSRSKLHSKYLTNFLTEIWNVPIADLKEYVDKFYPNPSAMELIEINELRRMVEANTPTYIKDDAGVEVKIDPVYLSDEQDKRLSNKYARMYGKEVQPVELSGRDGETIELTSMPREQVEEELNKRLDSVLTAFELVSEEEVTEEKKKDE